MAKSGFTPKLTTTDWNEEWITLQDARRAADDASYWDERSKTFHKSGKPSPYANLFIEYAQIAPKDTIFDMGCGNGALSIPLAIAGHEVIAADFSRGMLDSLEAEAQCHGNLSIDVRQFSWEDDWAAHGMSPKSVDVAIASRSIATHNLKESLMKLNEVARKRCCITLPVGSSPRTDAAILSAIGIQADLGKDFVYAFMILQHCGLLPEVRYIPSTRHDTFASTDEAFESLKRMVLDAGRELLDEQEMTQALNRLHTWVNENVMANPHEGQCGADGLPEKALVLRQERKVVWAFISWQASSLASSK